MDGLLEQEGNLGGEEESYLNMLAMLQNRLAKPTDITLELEGEELAGPTYRFTMRIALDEGGTPKPVRLYMIQVLDYYPGNDQYRNCLMQAAPTWDVTLAPGAPQIVEHEFTFDDDSWAVPEDIRIIAWAQAPYETGPAEVYQAELTAWPFLPADSCPADIDSDDDVDFDDLLMLVNNWGGSGEGDIDGNGVVNTADLLALLSAWGACP